MCPSLSNSSFIVGRLTFGDAVVAVNRSYASVELIARAVSFMLRIDAIEIHASLIEC
jgi:hypothetical protein